MTTSIPLNPTLNFLVKTLNEGSFFTRFMISHAGGICQKIPPVCTLFC